MFDESTLDKWVGHEMRSLHAGLVVRRKTLKQLLEEKEPQCVTKEGDVYIFDSDVLKKMATAASEAEKESLRLPITLRFDINMEDYCYIDDEHASTILRRLEGYGNAFLFRDGKMWIPYSIGMELLSKYKTAIQRIFVA